MTPEKFILDATAGFRMMWFNKQHPNTLYIDKRAECNPDIITDFKNLAFIKSESKKLIVFDPPHDCCHNNAKGTFTENFGALTPETWFSELKQGFEELWRILAPEGILLFKWNDHDKRLSQLQPCFPTDPLIMQITKQDYSIRSRKCKTKTFWICFMKIPEEAKT